MKIKKFLLKVFYIALMVYVGFGVFLFFAQRSMLYYPNNQDFENCPGFNEYTEVNHQGTRFYLKRRSEKVLIYYHGNAGSACDRSFTDSVFDQTDYSLLFVEYAGYSNDDQKPSQKLILKDVHNIHDFLKSESFAHIRIYGQSIGSGAASYHASLGNVDALILVTPFANLDDVAQSMYKIYPALILLREKYDNTKWLKNFTSPVLIIHGDNDNVIPHRFSKDLYLQLSTDQKEYILIPEKGHNDLWYSEIFKKTILRFLHN